MNHKIVVVGAGAFGTALSLSCLHTGAAVHLLTRSAEQATELTQSQHNHKYLDGIALPAELKITADPACLRTADLILLVTPAQKTIESLNAIKAHMAETTPLVLCAKGIHLEKKMLLSDVVRPLVANPIAVLSGPSFAIDMARNLPTAVMLAATTLDEAMQISHLLRHDRFRCYASQDMKGVQAGGALKNVIAIASGIVEGKALGENARAALLSRGLAEITRIGMVLGGQRETFMGLAGMGDLVLTGSSMTSRNYSLGVEIGKGKQFKDILAGRSSVTEGFATSSAVYHISKNAKIHTPIVDAVYDLLHNDRNVNETIERLLSRQSDTEF